MASTRYFPPTNTKPKNLPSAEPTRLDTVGLSRTTPAVAVTVTTVLTGHHFPVAARLPASVYLFEYFGPSPFKAAYLAYNPVPPALQAEAT